MGNQNTKINPKVQTGLLESIVGNIRDAVLVTEAWPMDEPGPRIIYANASFVRMTGYTMEEIVGKTPRILQGPGTDRARLDEIHAALAKREPVRTELLNYRKDGTEFWVEVDITPVNDEYGDCEYWVSVQRDTSERRRQQETLRESEERLRTMLVQYASDMITILEPDGTVRYQSPAIHEALGYLPEQVAGQSFYDYIHPEDIDRVTGKFHDAFGNPGASSSMEIRVRHADGSWRYIEGIANNLLDDPGVRGLVVNSRDVTERKEAEERYRVLVENVPTVVYIDDVNESNSVLYRSPFVREVLGYEPEDFLTDPYFWQNILHPEDRERVLAENDRTNETGEPFRIEYRMIHKDGRTVWIKDEAVLIRDEEGNPKFWQGYFADVTESKKAEERLAESEERYRSVAENVKEVIFQTDAKGNYTFLNPAWETVTGFTVEEGLGKSYLEFIHPDDLERNLEDFEQMGGHNGDYTEYEARFLAKDGSPRDIAIKFREHFEGGDLISTSGTLNDVTERKKIEDELIESEQRFRQLFEQSVDAMYVHNQEGRFVDCNSQACRLLGYTRGELLSMSVADISCNILTPEERDRKEEEEGGTLWQCVTEGKPGVFSQGHEEENIRKDGTVFPVEVRVGSVDYGGQRMVLASVRDISERRRTEEALRQSEEEFRGAFENASTGMSLVGLDNHYLRVNHTFCEMLGYPEEELMEKRSFDITHPGDRAKSRGRTNRTLEEGGPETMSIEKRYLKKDGEVMWAISSVSLV